MLETMTIFILKKYWLLTEATIKKGWFQNDLMQDRTQIPLQKISWPIFLWFVNLCVSANCYRVWPFSFWCFDRRKQQQCAINYMYSCHVIDRRGNYNELAKGLPQGFFSDHFLNILYLTLIDQFFSGKQYYTIFCLH